MLLVLVLSTAACKGPAEGRAATVVDSVVPRDVALARFRTGLTEPESLSGTAPSRDALVRRFIGALETRDTLALRAMVLTRAEFAWILYPTDPQGLPPYDLSPSLYWFMLDTHGQQGMGRLWQERAGNPLHYAGYRCLGDGTIEGENRLFGPCLVRRVQAPGDTIEERLFGPIIERHGRFKFVSYSNKVD
jgi:hypothetical protein